MPLRSTAVRLTIVAVLFGTIAFLALRTSPYLQYVPWMPRRIGIWADHHGIVRNVAAFFALALAVYFLVGRGWWTVIALCAFGTGVEVAQLWIPGRVFDWWDIAASITGVLLAWPVAWLLRSRPVAR
jgi:hypothetical protein